MGMRAATARNRGFLATENDLILFIDHDILLPPKFLKQLARYHRPGWVSAGRRIFLSPRFTKKIFSKERHFNSAFSLQTKIRAILGRWKGRRYLLPLADRRPGKRPQSWRGAAGFCFAVSRQDFEKVDGFDRRYDETYAAEDWDLFARLDHAGLNFGYLPRKCTVAHTYHPASAHDLNSRNYKMFEKVTSERAVKAVLGLETL